MSLIRPFGHADVFAVAELWLASFRRACTPEAARGMFAEVFLEHPFRDEGVESLVLVDGGEIKGFVGALPRRMRFRGRPLRVAVATQLMVRPGPCRAFGTFELLRALFDGRQDLTYGDGATDEAAAIWRRLGGAVARLYCLDWLRVLRPAGYLRHLLEQSSSTRTVAPALAPVTGALDALLARLPYGVVRPPRARLLEQALSADAVVALVARLGRSLAPDYAEGRLSWLLARAAAVGEYGLFRAALCHDERGEPAGWYAYYARPGGVSQVLQLEGRPRAIGGVIVNLLADAHAMGSVAVAGQAAPPFLRELTDQHGRFRCRSLGVLLHARSPDLVSAVERGDALLTRLDGAWWLPFGAAPRAA